MTVGSDLKLKDGTEVLIRPMEPADLERSFSFFQELPAEDRAYLRRDVTKREVVERRIRTMETGTIKRLVAVVDDKIVADGALDLATHGWGERVGEIRLIIARPYQRKGLGILMARELYSLAAAEKVEEIVVSMMRPQKAARSIFRKLGFHEEVMLPEYARDIGGKRQDVVVMRCDLEALWQEMEDFLDASDWRRAR
jgi:L-amino acid N-acyltransferase YncA